MTTQEKVIEMKKEIEQVAIKYGLNLTIYDGKIGFVSSSADASHTLLAGATVVEVTDDAAYVWLS